MSDRSRLVVLVGHGAPPSDFPRELVARLKALEAQRRRARAPMSDEERELDRRVRSHPRTPETDPYRAGLEALGRALEAALGEIEVVCAYNEFCGPSLEEAIAAGVGRGAREIVVVPSMLTPGGVHSEEEIPETLQAQREAHPHVSITYRWPFDLDRVARLLAEHALGR